MDGGLEPDRNPNAPRRVKGNSRCATPGAPGNPDRDCAPTRPAHNTKPGGRGRIHLDTTPLCPGWVAIARPSGHNPGTLPPSGRPGMKILALGPVSRILFPPLAQGSVVISLKPTLRWTCRGFVRLSPGEARVRHTRGYGTGRPAAYFALHQTGFFLPPTSPLARWALTPPFHPYPVGPALRRIKPGGLFSVTLSVIAP